MQPPSAVYKAILHCTLQKLIEQLRQYNSRDCLEGVL